MGLARTAIKIPVAASGALTGVFGNDSVSPQVLFLIYHSVDGSMGIELDMPHDLFERQIAFLAENRNVCSFDSALQVLGGQAEPDSNNMAPSVVLTFDDGYSDFYTSVYPLLVEYRLPAILYVTSGFVEDGTPYPMMSHPELCPLPVSWDMLGEMYESGLVIIGSHTHTHPVLTTRSMDEVERELVHPLELFESRLGFRPVHFAYPKAVANPLVEDLVRRYYRSAVVGDGQFATRDGFDPYAIPRVPVRRSDGWTFFRAKLRGWMAREERVYDAFRAINRRHGR